MDEINNDRYKKTNYIKNNYGLNRQTLYNYGSKGLIKFIEKNNVRYYDVVDVKKYLDNNFTKKKNMEEEENICYTRIIKEDIKELEEQINYFKINFPLYKIIYDVCDENIIGPNLLKVIHKIKLKEINTLILYDEQTISPDFKDLFLIIFRLFDISMYISHNMLSN